MGYLDYFKMVQDDTEIFLIYFLTVILIASFIDFILGWSNAKFNKNVQFISGVALYGIIKKMLYFIVLIFFMFTALILINHNISIPAIIGLFSGYLYSEVNSILSHLGLTDDGKQGEIFRTFVQRLWKGDENGKN